MDAMQLAVVVGAGGMGAAVARTLAADYRILLVDIDEQRSAAVVDEMRERGGRVSTRPNAISPHPKPSRRSPSG